MSKRELIKKIDELKQQEHQISIQISNLIKEERQSLINDFSVMVDKVYHPTPSELHLIKEVFDVEECGIYEYDENGKEYTEFKVKAKVITLNYQKLGYIRFFVDNEINITLDSVDDINDFLNKDIFYMKMKEVGEMMVNFQ